MPYRQGDAIEIHRERLQVKRAESGPTLQEAMRYGDTDSNHFWIQSNKGIVGRAVNTQSLVLFKQAMCWRVKALAFSLGTNLLCQGKTQHAYFPGTALGDRLDSFTCSFRTDHRRETHHRVASE